MVSLILSDEEAVQLRTLLGRSCGVELEQVWVQLVEMGIESLPEGEGDALMESLGIKVL